MWQCVTNLHGCLSSDEKNILVCRIGSYLLVSYVKYYCVRTKVMLFQIGISYQPIRLRQKQTSFLKSLDDYATD